MATNNAWNSNIPVSIAKGGSNATSFATTDGTIYFDGTSLVTTATGSSGDVLTSAGVGMPPAYAPPAASSITITGDTGGGLTGASFTFTGGTTGLSFGGAGSTQTLTFAGITANGGTVSLATDATGSTVNIGTGAGAKAVTLGSTNTTSSLALKYGTSDFTLASATGTVVSALDSGEVTMPLQPAFLAYLGTTDSNATGDGTVFTLGSGNALTEVFDQGSDFVTTGTFTAPVTGRYQLSCGIMVQSPAAGGQQIEIIINTSNRSYRIFSLPTRNRVTNFYGENAALPLTSSILADMDAADTVVWQIESDSGAKTDDILGSGANMFTVVSGFLAC